MRPCRYGSQGRIKAAVYARVSLVEQDASSQLVALRECCANRGWELTTEREYLDHGVSGAKDRRPGLDRMLKDMRAGRFKIVVVAGLDRLGRNVRHLLGLLDELNSLGVKFVSLREAIDLSTPQGQMTMTVLAAVAQLERDLTRQRVRETIAAKKLWAQKTGNGWRMGPPIKVTDALIAKVLQLREQGFSIREIERRLDKKISRGSIGRVLQGEGGYGLRPVSSLKAEAQAGETITPKIAGRIVK